MNEAEDRAFGKAGLSGELAYSHSWFSEVKDFQDRQPPGKRVNKIPFFVGLAFQSSVPLCKIIFYYAKQ